MNEQKETANQEQFTDDEVLQKAAGGYTEEEIKRMAKFTCPVCGIEFRFIYDTIIRCPNCYRDLPMWQTGATHISIEEYEAMGPKE